MAARTDGLSGLVAPLVALSGSGQRRQPRCAAVVRGAPWSDLSTLDRHVDFSLRADGAAPTTGDDGTALAYYSDLLAGTTASDVTVASGLVTHPSTLGPADPARYLQQLLPGAARVGAEFLMGAGTAAASSVTLSMYDTTSATARCHLTVTDVSWELSIIVSGPSIVSLKTGSFATALVKDWTGGQVGTVHRVEVSVYGDKAVLKLPDGSTQYVQDSRLATMTANSYFAEFYRLDLAGPALAIRRMWADDTPRPLDYATSVIDSNPAGWWRGNGTVDDELRGSSGSLANGAIYAASPAPRAAAQAFSLDGINDYVLMPAQAKLDKVDDITAEAWISPASIGTTQVITTTGSWMLYLDTAGQVNWWLSGVSIASAPITAGSSHHVAGTLVGTTMTLYVDGVQAATGTAAPALTAPGSGLFVGTNDAVNNWFAGRVAELAFYHRVLSPGEFTEHYLAAAPPSSGNGAGVWAFTGAAAGQRTPKASGTGNWAFTGAAGGSRTPKATATGSWAFAGAAAGSRTPKAAGTGSWVFTGTASGVRTPKATGSGSWLFTGAGAGSRTPKATATGSWAFAGTAVGVRQPKGQVAGSVTWVGAGAGFAPTVGGASGFGTGSWFFTGAAAGSTTRIGTGTGAWTWTGAASGTAPAVGGASGSGGGLLAWAGVATGTTTRRGVASGSWIYLGAATGAIPSGVVAGPLETLTVGPDKRTLTVTAEARVLNVTADNHTLAAIGS